MSSVITMQNAIDRAFISSGGGGSDTYTAGAGVKTERASLLGPDVYLNAISTLISWVLHVSVVAADVNLTCKSIKADNVMQLYKSPLPFIYEIKGMVM